MSTDSENLPWGSRPEGEELCVAGEVLRLTWEQFIFSVSLIILVKNLGSGIGFPSFWLKSKLGHFQAI